MNSTTRGIFVAAILMVANVAGATPMDISFDGETTGDWQLVNLSNGWETAMNLLAVSDYESSGLHGIGLEDITPGVSYYAAPPSVYETDLTDLTLNLNYKITGAGGASNFNTGFLADLYINEKPVAMDIIDASMVNMIQPVAIDFSDPVFDDMDLTNVSSLYIKAEWWGDDLGPESYLLSAVPVPEPAALQLLVASLFGLFGLAARRKSA